MGTIAGVVGGILGGVALAAFGLFYMRRRGGRNTDGTREVAGGGGGFFPTIWGRGDGTTGSLLRKRNAARYGVISRSEADEGYAYRDINAGVSNEEGALFPPSVDAGVRGGGEMSEYREGVPMVNFQPATVTGSSMPLHKLYEYVRAFYVFYPLSSSTYPITHSPNDPSTYPTSDPFAEPGSSIPLAHNLGPYVPLSQPDRSSLGAASSAIHYHDGVPEV